MRKHQYKTVILLIFVLVTNHAFSQSVVHAESNTTGKNTEGLTGKVNLNLNFAQNINDILQSNGNIELQYRRKQHSLLSMSAINLTIFNGSRILNDGMQHVRYGYKLKPNITIEAFSQAQYNEIIKIKGRYLNGFGPKFSFLQRDSIDFHLGTLYMYEHEEETTGIVNTHHRMSTYLSSGWQANDVIHLDLILYYQPDLMRWKDFRISTEFAMETTITKRLSYRLSVAWFYDAFPPEGIRNVFYNIRNGLSFNF